VRAVQFDAHDETSLFEQVFANPSGQAIRLAFADQHQWTCTPNKKSKRDTNRPSCQVEFSIVESQSSVDA
jgi:hypothetical protein